MRNADALGLEAVLEKVGRTLSENFGIRLLCRGDQCCTDGKTIYLPALPEEMPKDLYLALRGYLDHEAAHIVFSSDSRVLREFEAKWGKAGGFFLNMLEDVRVEDAMRRKYPGSGYNLANAYRYSEQAILARREQPSILIQMAFAVDSVSNGKPCPEFIGREVVGALGDVGGIVRQAKVCRNNRQTAELAERLWPALRRFLESGASAAGPRQPGRQSTPSNAQDGNGNPASGANGEQEAPGQAAADRQSETEADDRAENNRTESASVGREKDAAPNSNQAGADLDQAVGQGVMEQLAGLISEGVAAYARDTRIYRPWAREYDQVRLARDMSTRTHRERIGEVMPLVTGVRQHLLQALLAEPRARWRGDREEGRINPASLHRLVQPGPGKGDNPRVFRRKVRTKRLRAAATLLVDESSSMKSAGKQKLAADTALVFCEALSRLGVKTGVVGFSTSGIDLMDQAKRQTGLAEDELGRRYRLQPLRHTVYKRFDEPFQAVSGRMESINPSGLTPLGESMLFAARELAARPEERKVLFVLTDGCPCLDHLPRDMVFAYAREAIVRIEKAGIDVALVGIQEDSVQALHTRAVVVRQLDDLPRQALRELRKMLTA
jgi:cobalamin biosynthesis protein CobT